MMSKTAKEKPKEEFDIKKALMFETKKAPITQDLVLCVFSRSGEHGEVLKYINPNTGETRLRTGDEKGEPKPTRVLGIGITSPHVMTHNMTRMANQPRAKYKIVPIRKKNPQTKKMQTYQKKELIGYTTGYENIARHLSKFIPITTEELIELIEPLKDSQRIYFFSAYEGLGVCAIGSQPAWLESFMQVKNHWVVKGINSIPPILMSERRFAWLNKRLKEVQKSEVESGSGYWQVRI